jgi:hypothetical protein
MNNTTARPDVPDFLRTVTAEDGTIEGTLTGRNDYIVLPHDLDHICLDGSWTVAELRAIADYMEALQHVR